MKDALAVLSGGQDSATALARAENSEECNPIAAIHFQYGQEHAVEKEYAQRWADEYLIPLTVVQVDSLKEVGESSLTGTLGDRMGEPHPALQDLPNTFVPGRNLMFFTLAAAQAMKVGATDIVTGVCQRDYSGYPDCREETLEPLAEAIRQGMDFPEFRIYAPLLNRTKAETFALAERLGVLDAIIENTHTCYKGERGTLHKWGYGCGECPACEIRKEGYEEYMVEAQLKP